MTNKIPDNVRIGPFTYTIAPLSAVEGGKHGMMGWNHFPTLEIRYSEIVVPQKQAHTILHEILHGVWSTADLARKNEDPEVEEFYVTNLATALCDLIRNNPEVIAWISQTLAGPGEKTLHAVSEPPKTAAGMSEAELKALAAQKLVYVNDKPTLWA